MITQGGTIKKGITNKTLQSKKMAKEAQDWKVKREQEMANLEIGSQQSSTSSVAATTKLFR